MNGGRPVLQWNDWLLPAGLALAGVAEVFTVAGLPRGAAIASVVVPSALLLGRRRNPLVFATASAATLLLSAHLGIPDDALTVPLLILFAGCFALGRYEPTWWKGAAAVAALDLTVHWSFGIEVPPLEDWLWVAALTFVPWSAGRLVLAHVRQRDLLAVQAQQLVEEQRHVAERAVVDERRRIARELHDVIAHSISVMVVQAGAARELLGRDEAGVAGSLDEIQRSGRAALGETGRLLGLLREEAEMAAPQPTAAEIPALVADFRESGLDVELQMEGNTDGLPAGLDLNLYRIVEEGLTNVLKHTPAAGVEVLLRRTPDRVLVELSSATSGLVSRLPSGGHGLVGMRERVAVFGGSLDAGPTADGGFRVSARLPLGQPA